MARSRRKLKGWSAYVWKFKREYRHHTSHFKEQRNKRFLKVEFEIAEDKTPILDLMAYLIPKESDFEYILMYA